ncbi:MAG: histidine phosphatase family protein [Patescibacteria group bacterium]|jgi:broad specificity phosphatase PhoE
MLKIYLARHGQDEDNANGILNGRRDEPLTETGIGQANLLVQKIIDANLTFDVIYSSPLQRAFKTAQIISDSLNLPAPIQLDELIERDFGVMTGERISDVETLCSPDIIKTDKIVYFLSLKNAETFPELCVRAQNVLNIIQNKHQDGSILLVTHGDLGKMIYAAYYGLDWSKILPMFHFGNSELLILSPDSGPEDSHVFQIEQYNH